MAHYFNVNQLKLVSAISAEIAKQCPGITVDTEQFNKIIAAANIVKAAYEVPEKSNNPLDNLTDDVEKIVDLLSGNEWAEHVASTPLGQRLESQITDLLNRINGSWD